MNTRLSILRGMPLIAMLLLTQAMTASPTRPRNLRSSCPTTRWAWPRRSAPPARSTSPTRSSRASAATAAAAAPATRPQDGWTVTPQTIRARFDATGARIRSSAPTTAPFRRYADVSTRRRAPARLRHAAHQGPDPRRHRHSGERRVRARRRRRSLRLRERRGAVAVPPAAAVHEPQVPEHRHVGWTRDVQGSRRPPIASTGAIAACFASLHFNLADQANGATARARAGRAIADARRSATRSSLSRRASTPRSSSTTRPDC